MGNLTCSKSTFTAGRVQVVPGGAPCDGSKFTWQAINPEIIHEFQDFLMQDDISRPSSCSSVLVNGQETEVRYWQCDIKHVVQQYQLKFPNGVKRTYIYSMLAGFTTYAITFDIQTLNLFCYIWMSSRKMMLYLTPCICVNDKIPNASQGGKQKILSQNSVHLSNTHTSTPYWML